MEARTDLIGLQDITRIWASFHFLPYDLYAPVKRASRAYRNKYRLICQPNGALVRDTVELAKKRGTQAIGIGYGGSALTSLSRLPGFAMHMVFGLIMGLFLGLARYKKQAGERGGGEACLALLLPVLWHTAYDAATGFNLALSSEDEKVQFLGVIVWLTVIGVSTVLQFVVLIRFKKKTGKYCAMELQGSPDAARAERTGRALRPNRATLSYTGRRAAFPLPGEQKTARLYRKNGKASLFHSQKPGSHTTIRRYRIAGIIGHILPPVSGSQGRRPSSFSSEGRL